MSSASFARQSIRIEPQKISIYMKHFINDFTQEQDDFLIDNYNLEILEGHKTFFIYEHFKQVPEFQPISESVCLISR
jgi:hypothetical protein